MEDVVICPHCGETNPKDLPFCQHCQWRLHSLAPESEPDSYADSTTSSHQPSGTPDEPASIPDWLARPGSSGDSDGEQSRRPVSPRGDDAVRGDDLLAGLALQREAEPEDIPEWVARIMGIAPQEPSPEAAASDSPTHVPGANQPGPSGGSPVTIDSAPVAPDELAEETDEPQMGAITPADSVAEQSTDADNEINQWLRQLDASAARREIASRPRGIGAAQDVPTWVDQMLGVSATTPLGANREGESLPDWLAESVPPEHPALTSTRSGESIPAEEIPATDETDVPGVTARQTSAGSPQAVPPFPPEEIHKLDVDAVLGSMQMPDWLADLGGGQTAASDAGQIPENAEPIAKANLPSWVEAMRPMEYASPVPTDAREVRPEQRGPLLGLHGVLPSIPGAAAPSSRPKSQSIRLEASERQIAHARLLEDLLAAEARPAPLSGEPEGGPQNALRRLIGALMVLVVGGAVFSGSRFFPLPTGVPIESNAAILTVHNIEPGAPVLAVFDYEPATAGEMEATASSLMDHLLLLRHPRLAVVSTSATGSALAEHFISTVLAERAYVRGVQYVNLGFLPGGLTGVRLFAEDPVAAAPLGAAADRVWDSPILAGTRRLQDFAAIILITDGLESGRVWIEQTEHVRGSSQVIVVSSAQAGPMLLPYFNSGQIQGLVAGLNGAAGPELSNSGLPGIVRRYWDSYSLGLYVAALVLLGGAAWNATKAARERHRDLA